MRRALIGLAVAALTVLAVAGPASAAPSPVVMRVTFHGTFANALWSTSSATSITNTTINAAQTPHPHGFMLFVDQSIINLDESGNVTRVTDTAFVVTSGFSFVIGKTLESASLSGSSLPVSTCTYDPATGILIGCMDTTIDVNASWTAQGPLVPSVTNFHFKTAGFIENDHFNGTSRTATATGTVGGITLSAADLQGASLGTANSGTITICKGNPSFCQ